MLELPSRVSKIDPKVQAAATLGRVKTQYDQEVNKNVRNLLASISEDHFKAMSGSDGYRLRKSKFKAFIATKYGPILAEKMCIIFTFSLPVDFTEFKA